nr:30S ribosomal protein S8 [Nanoarchaeum sp.]
MSMNDTLANAMSQILNAEKVGKTECDIKNVSKIIKIIMEILKENDYIGDYVVTSNVKGEYINVKLLGKINKCGAIKPRFPVKLDEYEKFEKRYLPANDFGIMIVSTSKGMMTHNKAIDQKLGGKLIAYCY